MCKLHNTVCYLILIIRLFDYSNIGKYLPVAAALGNGRQLLGLACDRGLGSRRLAHSRLGGRDGAGLGAVADGLRGLLGEELELALLGDEASVT